MADRDLRSKTLSRDGESAELRISRSNSRSPAYESGRIELSDVSLRSYKLSGRGDGVKNSSPKPNDQSPKERDSKKCELRIGDKRLTLFTGC